jgi:hypothetical protein
LYFSWRQRFLFIFIFPLAKHKHKRTLNTRGSIFTLTSVTDTIFHLHVDFIVVEMTLNFIHLLRWTLSSGGDHQSGQCHGHDTSPAAEQWSRIHPFMGGEISGWAAPVSNGAFHNSFSELPVVFRMPSTAAFHSIPRLLPASAGTLSHFQPRTSRAVQQRCPHHFVFPPPSFPAPFLSPLSLFLSALAMRSLSSSLLSPLRVFPLYSPSSFLFLIVVWVFRTPYGSAGQLTLCV